MARCVIYVANELMHEHAYVLSVVLRNAVMLVAGAARVPSAADR